MSFSSFNVAAPKNGNTYQVIAVCRISTEHQDERSLDDQRALYEEWLDQNLDGPYELHVIAGQGSGEDLEREDYKKLLQLIASGRFDFVIAEDLSRICRRIDAIKVCELAVDFSTRVIAINDCVDTASEGWEQGAFFAAFHHERTTRETSRRIRRSQRNRFSSGQLPIRLIAGYDAPDRSAVDSEISKNPDAESIVDEIFSRLDRGETFAEIADWLNSIAFPVGPYTRAIDWNGTRVGQYVRNPLLKGQAVHNVHQSERVNITGRHKSVPAPADMLLTRNVPHLAFIEPERFDRILRKIDGRNAKYRRGIADAGDCRKGRLRRDTRWPGQHVRCGICGRKFVLGGHGKKDRMMCDGVRNYNCWNAMTVDRDALATGVADRIRVVVERLPDFDADWTERLKAEATEQSQANGRKLIQLRNDAGKLQRECKNLAQAVADGRGSVTLQSMLVEKETQHAVVLDSIQEIESKVSGRIEIPSADTVREIASATFLKLARESREFGDVMRELVDGFYVLPYRLIDGGNIEPRCVFDVHLSRLDGLVVPDDAEGLQLSCAVDLTKCVQRVKHRAQVTELRASGMKYLDIAERLGITMPAAQNAAALHRRMIAEDVTDPWQPVRTEDEARTQFKRLRNDRYCFVPLPGFTQKFPAEFMNQGDLAS